MKLALGTAQFGMLYGIANSTGQPNDAMVVSILERAMSVGVTVLDTASLYGEAEKVLGRCLPVGHRFRIISKTPKFGGLNSGDASDRLEAALAASCRKLRLASLEGLLAHDADDLLGPVGDVLWRRMSDLRDQGLVAKIGASVYSGGQIDAILNRFTPDLVQIPLSILDQRLIEGGQLERLGSRGIEVHSRSVFLQGALLMGSSRLPNHLRALGPSLIRIEQKANELKTDTVALALKFVVGQPVISAIVCGVDSLWQFEQIINAINGTGGEIDVSETAALACRDPFLLDPSKWKIQ